MKFFIGLLVVTSLALNGVLSLPARNPSDDAEVIGYPRRVSTKADTEDDDDFKDFKGIIDTGSGYPFLQPNPSVLNFGFFDSFDDIFRRFSARLWPTSLLGRGDGDSDEDSGSGGIGITTNFDPKKGNTTSTVKVVDGHKVEVNETVYGDEHSIFKVRVVNVRPLEEGETVEETVQTGEQQPDSVKPVTSSPEEKASNSEEDDEGRREPLEKKPNDNEIERNIDDPEHSKTTSTVTENIVETTAATALHENDHQQTMLPTAEEVAFVADNSLGGGEAATAEELNSDGNGNNEFETNMSSDGEGTNVDDAIATATDIAATIENNEDTEEMNDNLNESSNDENDDDGSDSEVDDADDGDNNKTNEFEDVEDVDGAVVNSNVKRPKYAAIRNKPREDVSSSDDEEDPAAVAAGMHPTFNDEWGSYNEEPNHQIGINKENNDLSNDIDVYDVEPIDLSNDIAVNDSPNLPINPDAEFIDIFGAKQTLSTMPKFEKLSLSQMPEDEHLSSFSGEMK